MMIEPERQEQAPFSQNARHRGPEATLTEGIVVNGKYRLQRLIARGGMGAVWTARHLALEIDVAIKFLLDSAADLTTPLRLKKEARLLACIQHQSLVNVHDVGVSESGVHFLVMDLLTGTDLSEHLAEQGALPPIDAVRLLLPIVDALRAAHRQTIIHRDIKPENIFLAQVQGRLVPKLLDFGVALARKDPIDQRLTRAGAIIGSPLYLSPEQARGARDLDDRVDVWGMCAVMYECLVGWPPFSAESYEALLHAIVTDAPPAIGLTGGAAALEAIVMKGLHKAPASRWESAEALGRALASWLLNQGIEEDSLNQRLRSIWWQASEATLVAQQGPSLSEPRGSGELLGAKSAPRDPRAAQPFSLGRWRAPSWAKVAAGAVGIAALSSMGFAAFPSSHPAAADQRQPNHGGRPVVVREPVPGPPDFAATAATADLGVHAAPTRPAQKSAATGAARREPTTSELPSDAAPVVSKVGPRATPVSRQERAEEARQLDSATNEPQPVSKPRSTQRTAAYDAIWGF